MKIHYVKAEGFLSLGKVELDLNRSGVTLVEGFNHDSPAESNGAGKSSLFEALYWGLYGITRRPGLGVDDVINRHYKGPTEVVVAFSKGGSDYVVQRGRGKVGTLAFMLADGKDLTKGTTKDTQALIEETIGLSPVAFAKAVFFGQGDVRPLTEMTDGELKAVFEQGLGLSRVSEDAEKASMHRKALESQVSVKRNELHTARLLLNAATGALGGWKERFESFEDDRKEAIVDAEDELLKANERFVSLDKLLGGLRGRKAALEDGLNANAAELKELGRVGAVLRAKLERERERASGYAEQARQQERRLEELGEERKGLVDAEGGRCEYCGLVMDRAAVETSLAGLHERMAGVSGYLDKAKKAFAVVNGKVERLEALLAQVEEKIAECGREDAKLNHDLMSTGAKLAEISAKEIACKADIERLQEELEKLVRSTEAGLGEDVKRAEIAVADAEAKVSGLEEEVNDLAAALEIAEMLSKALGNGGVRSMVLGRVIPAVNAYANEYLSALDPGLSVAVSATTKLKSGETREKFSMEVTSREGAKTYAGHSGGEKQKVNLAVSLAFNRLMRESAEVPDLLVLDEPFESLDAGSSEQVVELLAGLSANNVYLITHNQSVKDLLPNSIRVDKCAGVSAIMG